MRATRGRGGRLVLVLEGREGPEEDSARRGRACSPRAGGARGPVRPGRGRPRAARPGGGAAAGAGGGVVELGPLPADDVAALVAGLVGAPAGDNLRRFAAGAGGNPRYAREAVDVLVRDGLVEHRDGVAEIDADAAGQAPPSLVPVLTGWLGFLSPGAAEALRWVALLDDGCTA
ncbi:transcriptional regulator, partial [Saccharothrix algeriensis]